MSDNRHFELRCTALKPSLKIAFASNKATHYKATPDKLLFAWHEAAGEGFIPLLVPLDAETAEPVVRQWLNEQAQYTPQPDHDGDNERSWRIYNEAWNMVGGNFYVFVAIEPCWAVYGK